MDPVSPTPPELKNEEYTPTTPQMRTFSTDLAEELRKHQGSAMKIAVMENERRLREKEDAENDPKKNSRLVLAGVIILFLSIVGSVGLYIYQKKVNTPPPVDTAKAVPSLIQSEDYLVLNITNKPADEIAALLNTTVQKSNVQTGMIDSIYFTQGATTSETRLPANMFLTAIQSHIDPQFERSLNQDYMMGIYSYGTPHLFAVFRGSQHDVMLAGMLQWEPFLTQDMAPLFGIDTTKDNAYLLNEPYSETLVENHDTRAVLDTDKKPVLFYSFLDPNTVIITNDSQTLIEAVRRMSK